MFDHEPTTTRAVFPDTDAGFRSFIKELVNANGKTDSVQGRMHSLIIPNSSAWFIKFFGPTTGPTLDYQYRYELGWQFGRLYSYLPLYARGQNHLLHTEKCELGQQCPFVTNSLLISVAEQPFRIFSASIATVEEGPWLKVGSFVYVDGGFRFMGSLEINPDWKSFHTGYERPFDN